MYYNSLSEFVGNKILGYVEKGEKLYESGGDTKRS